MGNAQTKSDPALPPRDRCCECGKAKSALVPPQKLMRCSLCKLAYFCSRECQATSWRSGRGGKGVASHGRQHQQSESTHHNKAQCEALRVGKHCLPRVAQVLRDSSGASIANPECLVPSECTRLRAFTRKDRTEMLSLLLGTHPRCGKASPVRSLPVDTLRRVYSFLRPNARHRLRACWCDVGNRNAFRYYVLSRRAELQLESGDPEMWSAHQRAELTNGFLDMTAPGARESYGPTTAMYEFGRRHAEEFGIKLIIHKGARSFAFESLNGLKKGEEGYVKECQELVKKFKEAYAAPEHAEERQALEEKAEELKLERIRVTKEYGMQKTCLCVALRRPCTVHAEARCPKGSTLPRCCPQICRDTNPYNRFPAGTFLGDPFDETSLNFMMIGTELTACALDHYSVLQSLTDEQLRARYPLACKERWGGDDHHYDEDGGAGVPLYALLAGEGSVCEDCGADGEQFFSFCLNRPVNKDRVAHCEFCGKCFYYRPGAMFGCEHCGWGTDHANEDFSRETLRRYKKGQGTGCSMPPDAGYYARGLAGEGYWGF